MVLKNRPEALSLLAAVLALASIGYAKGIVGYQVWTTDAGYSFGLQVLLPRIGLVISGFIGACAAFSIASKYSQPPDQLSTVYKLASIMMFIIGVGLLIYGFWDWRTDYQLIYSIFGPAFIGNGMFIFIHKLKWLKNKAVTTTIAAVLMILAFVLASIGKPSPFDVWQFIVVLNGGTGLFILMAALSGSFVVNGMLRQS
ncbi:MULTISPECIES: hypothetical protein [Enterobacteriaceae]|uniref:Uncharacterized protein n=1 Tax=Phytobacter diazotrophicus TaxID=395631 RepID=A0ABN6LVW6_9ENTR|nr:MULTISPECIES: hypothetical protein [Enterobacteriaceae]HAU8263735.1 hypothetical protein [Kluyvera intermedia]KLP94070.1 hypothetical protein ABF78_08700 [Enterobacter asburiae]BDD49314.1 hypothetical protein PDTA9734_08010 [Phytobacter diazotrophicus]BDD53456.1 hypothetical protein PDTA9734_49430 [Phytobacter diazotrophicus]BEG80346.1 hypothetical protein PDTA9730_08020 [Phytobacter diazotrophicus]